MFLEHNGVSHVQRGLTCSIIREMTFRCWQWTTLRGYCMKCMTHMPSHLDIWLRTEFIHFIFVPDERSSLKQVSGLDIYLNSMKFLCHWNCFLRNKHQNYSEWISTLSLKIILDYYIESFTVICSQYHIHMNDAWHLYIILLLRIQCYIHCFTYSSEQFNEVGLI